jgi:phosphatidylinositol alpha-1,6-mannosyltransferase
VKAKKSNIIIITSEFPPQPGGIGNHAYNLAGQLSHHGFNVKVIADMRSIEGKEEELFDKMLPFKVDRIVITSPRFFMYFKRVVSIFRLVKSAHYVIATGKFSLWSAALCSLFFSRNYIAIVHGSEVNFKNKLIRESISFSLNRFKTIIAVSNYTQRLISHVKHEIRVIPNGVHSNRWNKEIKKGSYYLSGYPRLTTIGNVTSRKGQQNVISHLPKLIENFPELHFHCIGLNTETDDFLKLAKALKVESHITFHGRLNDAALQGALLETDILVMLSTKTDEGAVEGFGIAILEANSLGIPAIGAKDCGVEDAIDDGKSGILIDPLNAKEFLEAIKTILDHKTKYQKESEKWAAKHEWSDIIKLYLESLI